MYLWFLPCSQPAPGPGHHLCAGLRRDRRCSGKVPEWKRVVPQPHLPGQGESGLQSPCSWPACASPAAGEPVTPWLRGSCPRH